MKYRQLTKEQFLELHQEFAEFLATQQIDMKEWDIMKQENSNMAEEELNIFSDIVWENTLTKIEYLDHISDRYINLFNCNSQEILRICVSLSDKNKSFLNDSDYQWFLKNPLNDQISYSKGVKKYKKDRNKELFEMIEMGSEISEGALFQQINQLI